MQTRSSLNSVLGKRSHQIDTAVSANISCDEAFAVTQLPLTPELTPKPKRARVSLSTVDGDSNKENIPPFSGEVLNETSPSLLRSSLRRTSTELISPSRPRTTRRHASTSNVLALPCTPASAISHLAISTPPPTPPLSLLPIHARARSLLRATCNSSLHIAGRDEERDTIKQFIVSFFAAETPENDVATLYISGTPGTGKTALVNSILSSLEDAERSDRKIVSINCMALNSIDALWDRLSEELCNASDAKSPNKTRKVKGKQAVEKALAGMGYRCILILDELDHIAASSENLNSIFSLAQTYNTTLRIIGIANTHTLTSSLSQCPDTSVNTVHFAAYTPTQLLQILQTRLSPLYDTKDGSDGAEQSKKFLPAPTLTLLTKKIATQTGDVRALFEVLRGAIDLAVSATSTTMDTDANPLASSPPVVTPTHILNALKAYTPSSALSSSTVTSHSEVVVKVHNLGLQHRLVLLSIILASKRLEASLPFCGSASLTKSPTKRTLSSTSLLNGSGGIDASQLHSYYSAILTRGDSGLFTPVSRSEFGDLVGMLETAGLVSIMSAHNPLSSPSKSGRRAFGRSSSFGGPSKGAAAAQEVKLAESIRVDEVLRGLGVIGTDGGAANTTGVREEEIKAIWIKESFRLSKDIKARTVKCNDCAENPFHDAVED